MVVFGKGGGCQGEPVILKEPMYCGEKERYDGGKVRYGMCVLRYGKGRLN